MAVFVANTNILELLALKSAIEDTFINNATVTVTVKDKADVEVEGQAWPTTMSYVSDSDGDYRATLSDECAFVAGSDYFAFIDVDGGANRVGHWKFKFRTVERR